MNLKLGEAARLKPLEVELKRLEDLSEAIVQDFAYMRAREEEMRDTNGTITFLFTAALFFNIISFGRIYELPCIVFQCDQYAVFDFIGDVASPLPAPFLQSQKIDRIVKELLDSIVMF